MRAATLLLNLLLVTVIAVLACYCAILTIQIGGIHSADWTDADLIRRRCPIRLIQPEWVSSQPDTLGNWWVGETRARLSLIGVLWLAGVSINVWSYLTKRKELLLRTEAGFIR